MWLGQTHTEVRLLLHVLPYTTIISPPNWEELARHQDSPSPFTLAVGVARVLSLRGTGESTLNGESFKCKMPPREKTKVEFKKKSRVRYSWCKTWLIISSVVLNPSLEKFHSGIIKSSCYTDNHRSVAVTQSSGHAWACSSFCCPLANCRLPLASCHHHRIVWDERLSHPVCVLHPHLPPTVRFNIKQTSPCPVSWMSNCNL